MTSAKEAKRFCQNIVKMGQCRTSFDPSKVQFSPNVVSALENFIENLTPLLTSAMIARLQD